jgi:hypothetical protein
MQIRRFIVVLNSTIFSIKRLSYQKLIIYVHISAHFDPVRESEDAVIVHVCIFGRAYIKIFLFIIIDETTEELLNGF